MADNKITEYNSHAAPATGDQFFMIGASEEYRIDYDALANAILNKLTSKTYSGISNNVIDAIAALNSRLPHLNYINASSFEEATSLQTDTYLNIIDVLGTVDSPNSSYNRWFGFQYLNGTKKYGFQIAFSFGISALYMRRRNNSDTWTEWTAIQ